MLIDELLLDARARLAGIPQVPMGRLAHPPRLLSAFVGTRIVPDGSAWALGVLLLGVDRRGVDGVWATGEVVRARPEDRRGYTAESARRRGELAAAASRGGFADGVAVQLPAMRLDVAGVGADGLDPAGLDVAGPASAGAASAELTSDPASPLAIIDGVPMVRWSASAPMMPLAPYLDERIRLLLDPPARA